MNTLSDLAQRYGIRHQDYALARNIIGDRPADIVIAPDGKPYLYRWHAIPHNKTGNVYFHIQVADDPERPLHDHPWDNMSVILAGGYRELFQADPPDGGVSDRVVLAGEMVCRRARAAHRLLMLHGIPYTMTLFTTGPKIHKWGFWYPEGWINADDVCRLEGNVSVHVRG